MFRHDVDTDDPHLPAWLVPWVYPIGLGLLGVGLVIAWALGLIPSLR